jgi:hypothetical protein
VNTLPFAVDPTVAAMVAADMQNEFVRSGAPAEVPLHRAKPRSLAAKFALVSDTAVLLNTIGTAPRTSPRAPPASATCHAIPPPTAPEAEESSKWLS